MGTAFGTAWTAESYGQLQDVALEVRALIKAEFTELKEKDIKEVLDSKIWLFQKGLDGKSRKRYREVIGTEQFDDFNQFDEVLKKPSSRPTSSWMPKRRNSLLDAITWKNPEARTGD